MKQQNDNDCNIIDKIYLYIKDPDEVKYFIKKHEKTMQEHKDRKYLIKYLNNMQK